MAAVAGTADAAVLVIQIGDLADAFVVDGDGVRADAALATELLVRAAGAPARPPGAIDQALAAVAPLVAARLAAVQAARWRSPDRTAAEMTGPPG